LLNNFKIYFGIIMKNNFVLPILFFLVLLSAGCKTQLKVERLENETYLEALAGPIFYLPTAKLDIVVKRQLDKCEVENINNGQDKKVNIIFSVEADVTPKYIPDLTTPYLFEYEELNDIFKKTTLNIELYENGTIKKINGNISDRTGEVIQNTTKGAIQIARMAMGLPAVTPPANFSFVLDQFCNEETRDAINHYDDSSKEIRKLIKKLPSYGPNDRPEKELELKEKKTELAKYASHLTHKKLYSSIPAFDDSEEWNKQLPVPTSIFLKWFHTDQVKPLVTLKNEIKQFKQDEARLLKEANQATEPEIKEAKKEEAKMKRQLAEDAINVFHDVVNNPNLSRAMQDIATELNAKATINISRSLITKSSREKANASGSFVYRQPGSATLNVCKFSSCEEKTNVIHRKDYLLPQAGIYTTLPLVNKLFDDNVLTAKFGPSGNLESFDYITEAQAEKASASFAETVGAAGNIVDADRDSNLIKLQRELDLINLQNQILEAESTRDCFLDPNKCD
jgi:hypothetical protein